jgi:squalene synthase HpnC
MTFTDPPPAAPGEDAAYAHVLAFTRSHYENFPVASRLLRRDLRRDVAAVYAFARHADDFADEAAFEGRRLALLDDWERRLDAVAAGEPASDPVFAALGATIRDRCLPVGLLRDLLTAFRRDVTTRRHAAFADLLDYCRYSANPVGRLVLWLHGYRDEDLARLSDHLTSALQLANFWQDVAVDRAKDRVYLPLEDLTRFGVSEADLARPAATPGFRDLLRFEVERTRALFGEGAGLIERVGRDLALELRLTWLGGVRILEKIEAGGFDTLRARPTLGKLDWVKLLARALGGGRLA